ncbi:MAG: response regulator [Pseudomonadota bacterium]
MTFRSDLEQEQTKIAEVIAANISAAVIFNDTTTIEESIAALSLTPQAHSAFVYDSENTLVGQWNRHTASIDEETSNKPTIAAQNKLHVEVPIMIYDEKVGRLDVIIGLEGIERTITQYLYIAAIVLSTALILTFFMAQALSRVASLPVERLDEAMTRVRSTRDYSKRAEKIADDEFGRLTENFNAMLDEIQARDHELANVVAQLEEARDSAEAANVSKSQFLANMSHELRTPLNAIIGYSEIVREDLEDLDSEETVSDVDKINKAAHHLLGLINEVLDLSKIEAGRMTLDVHDVDLNALIEDVAATVEPLAAKRNNKLKIVSEDAPAMLVSDSVKIRQCLLNLLSNASKFTENGDIELAVRRAPNTGDATEMVEFRVRDTGIGMTSEQLSRLFTAFVQADASTTRKYGGTGLGLAITKKLTELLGGEVDVVSTVGEGSTFIITIPTFILKDAADEEVIEEKKQDAVAALTKLEKTEDVHTVLVIDDYASAIDLMRRTLTPTGFEVIGAQDGETGLRLAKELEPDAIILDIKLPDISGWDILQTLNSDPKTTNIPVFVVTIEDDRERGLALGASEFLVKPVKREGIIQLMSSYLKAEKADVLLLEDDPDSADIIRRIATQAGHTCRHAENGVEGYKALQEHTPDIILLDLMMPEMDGFEFLRKIRSEDEYKGVPVIVISAKTLTEADRVFVSDMAEQYHQKGSLPPSKLVNAINNIRGVSLNATVH